MSYIFSGAVSCEDVAGQAKVQGETEIFQGTCERFSNAHIDKIK